MEIRSKFLATTIVAIAAATVFSGCSAGTSETTNHENVNPAVNQVGLDTAPFEVPKESVDAREANEFKSLREMAAASDLIIIGVVERVAPGRTVGAGKTLQFRELSVRVEKVLKGPSGSSIVVEEEGTWAGNHQYSINGSRWAKQGARAVFFLTRKVGEPGEPYRLTNSHSRFFLHGGRVYVNSPQEVSDFEAKLERVDEAGLINEIQSQAGLG